VSHDDTCLGAKAGPRISKLIGAVLSMCWQWVRKSRLEEFLEDYRRRLDAALDAACGEWNAWDAEAGSARRSLSGGHPDIEPTSPPGPSVTGFGFRAAREPTVASSIQNDSGLPQGPAGPFRGMLSVR
jgi:hypothetical protein